jgi:hypothetical protein
MIVKQTALSVGEKETAISTLLPLSADSLSIVKCQRRVNEMTLTLIDSVRTSCHGPRLQYSAVQYWRELKYSLHGVYTDDGRLCSAFC